MAAHGPHCAAITLKGSRCKNRPKPGSTLCAVHERARKKLGDLGKKGGGEKPTLAALRFRDERGRLTSRPGVRPDSSRPGTPHTVRADAIQPGDVLQGFQVEKVEPGSKPGTVRIHVGNGVRVLAPADRDVDIVRGGNGGKPGKIPPAPKPTPAPKPKPKPAVPSVNDIRRAVAKARTDVGDPANIGRRGHSEDEEMDLKIAALRRRQIADLIERGDWDALLARPVSTNPHAPALDLVPGRRRADFLNSYRNNPTLRAETVADLRRSANFLIDRSNADRSDSGPDGIPGPTTIAKINAIRQAGAAVNRRIDARAAELAGNPEFDPKRIKTLQRALDTAEAGTDQRAIKDAITALRVHQDQQRLHELHRGQAQREILAEIRPMGGTLNYGPQTDVMGRGTIAPTLDNFPTNWLARAASDGPIDVEVLPEGGRGQYDPSIRRIDVMSGDTRVATHEVTHLMETAVPGLRAAQWAYHAQRNTLVARGQRRWIPGSGELRRLLDVDPTRGYKPTEKGRTDTFTHPYAGKVYGNGGPEQHWEIASMGSESFASTNSITRDDPDTRDFIIGLWAVL